MQSTYIVTIDFNTKTHLDNALKKKTTYMIFDGTDLKQQYIIRISIESNQGRLKFPEGCLKFLEAMYRKQLIKNRK